MFDHDYYLWHCWRISVLCVDAWFGCGSISILVSQNHIDTKDASIALSHTCSWDSHSECVIQVLSKLGDWKVALESHHKFSSSSSTNCRGCVDKVLRVLKKSLRVVNSIYSHCCRKRFIKSWGKHHKFAYLDRKLDCPVNTIGSCWKLQEKSLSCKDWFIKS